MSAKRSAAEHLRAVPDTPRTAAQEMPLPYLECHAEGHWWQHVGDTDVMKVGRRIVGFARQHVCSRCGEERRVVRGQNFQIISRSYTQPAGYSLRREGDEVYESHRYTAMREILHREGIRYS